MTPTGMHQTCYSYNVRELAAKLGLRVQPDEWVVVEVDQDEVDVMVRKNAPSRAVAESASL